MNQRNGYDTDFEEQGDEQQSLLSSPLSMTKTQMLLTGVPIVATGVLEVASHFNFGGLLLGGFITLAVARHSQDILHYLVPGSDVARVASATDRVVDAISPMHEEDDDQAVFSKLKRLVGIDPPRMDPVPKNATQHEDANARRSATENVSASVAPRLVPRPERAVDLASNLQIDVDEISGKATFIVGMRRSGKTTLGVRIAEEMGRFSLPCFIPDLEGDWLSLSDPGMLPNCVVAGHPDSYKSNARYTFSPVSTTQEAYKLGYDILENGLQVILDMASYDTIEDAVILTVSIIKGIFAWTKEFPDELCPCDIYLDEAQRFLPQDLEDSIIQDTHLVRNLLKTYMDIIAVGGKRGLTPKILSQRFAQTNNKIMAQSEVFFILRQTNDNDLTRCMEYVKKSVATKEQIGAFAPGQGVYSGADGTQLVTRFKKRRSDGSRSHTPKAEVAKRYAEKPVGSYARRVADASLPTEKLVPVVPERKMPTLEEKYAKEIAVWESLKDRGEAKLRPFAEAMDLKETKAYDLLTELADEGLIEWERRKAKS